MFYSPTTWFASLSAYTATMLPVILVVGKGRWRADGAAVMPAAVDRHHGCADAARHRAGVIICWLRLCKVERSLAPGRDSRRVYIAALLDRIGQLRASV